MAEPSPDSVLVKILGPAISAALGWLLGLLPGGLTGSIASPLTTLFGVAGGLSGLIFSLMYKRYIGVLAASAHDKNSIDRNARAERQAYDELRKSLRGGNIAARLYADWLTAFLDAVDRFFGDASIADRTLFPHAFGLRTPAPLWTAPAFDRCLLLALFYPLATIFIIWAVSGHVGPAEAALGLMTDMVGWQRGVVVGLTGLSIVSLWRAMRTKRFKSVVMWTVVAFGSAIAGAVSVGGGVAVALGGAGAVASVVAVAVALTAGIAVALGGSGAGAVASAVATAVFNGVAGAGAFAGTVAVAGAVAGTVACTGLVAILILNSIAIKKGRQGVFLSLYLFAIVLICFGTASWLPHFERWVAGGPLLLFFGLLTLINAPFDWASLGLTRALLRRGLERGGWWPYFLALADALAAAVIIGLLAITMVIGVQTFDHLAEHSGGVDKRILPLDKLFDGMAAQPSAPEYWWAYALLFSTMIPSLLNLMIGGASLLRGIPGLPARLLRFMLASKAVPTFDRTWLALVLTVQVFVGAFLGIAAQLVLAVGVIFYVLPWIGLELLDTARAVAEFDLPTRLFRLWWGDP
jgi:hypothetical protein